MTWNYRVMRCDPERAGYETYYGIAEVYYTSDGRLHTYSDPVRMQWDDEGDGPKMLEAMAKAFTLPVLTPEDFGG